VERRRKSWICISAIGGIAPLRQFPSSSGYRYPLYGYREGRRKERGDDEEGVDSPTPGLRKPINAIDLSVDEDTPRISHSSGPLGYPSPNQLQSCL
jgi:hypothetical protein